MSDDIRLPELPEPAMRDERPGYFTHPQMRDYARAAVLADRERRNSAERNQCDGCNAGWPLLHRDPNPTPLHNCSVECTAHMYQAPADDELRRDAERYRLMRGVIYAESNGEPFSVQQAKFADLLKSAPTPVSASDLERMLDAAMTQQGGRSGG